MMRKAARMATAAFLFVVGATNLADAAVRHHRHHTRYAHAYRLYSHRLYPRHDHASSKAMVGTMMRAPAHPYQNYTVHDGLGYGGVPEDPLIPIKPEVPPPIAHSGLPCYSLDDCDRKDYDESGTIGRLGLGASPYHPEGPGNPP